MIPRRRFAAAVACGVIAAVVCSPVAAESPQEPPDLTANRQVDRKLTYNLGSTGMRGWIHTRAATFLDSVQGRTTTAARQILVTHVGRGSPADGVMQIDDVILGVGGRPFDDDARKGIAAAIQEAERETNGGRLQLTRWRSGATEEVVITLPVLGTYAATAPYDCPKSQRVLAAAVKALGRERPRDDLWAAVDGLAMLASGDAGLLERAKDIARRMAVSADRQTGRDMGTWESGYRGVFLCEYHLLTGDKEVLPAIRVITLALARGQGMYGTFGHGFSELTPDGRLHGPIPPYGPVNAAGLIGNLAIVLGRECGVVDPEVDAAVDRGSKFFAYCVDKGSIPYGEHIPWPYHENNGKNALTALLFALQDDRTREARFFAKMVTAAYNNREYGHTGQGFSYLWGAPGAACGGRAAAAAFFKGASWHFDLVRRCDGSFTYDGGEQYGAGRTDDDTYFGRSGYYGLGPNACYVITYALPLARLRITGRKSNPAVRLGVGDVAEAVASGRFDVDRAKKSIPELVTALGDWSPIVRGWAAEELARRPEAKDLVPQLIAMAEGPDARVRQGACEALGCMKAVDALPVFVRLLVHEDRWLRVKAATALKNMGGAAKPVVPDMLRVVVKTAEPLEPIEWADPIQLTHGELAAALFGGLLRSSVDGVDPALLHPAFRAISRNADGMARATLRHLLEDQLTAEDVQALGPDILAAVMVRCPADTMFGNEIRMGAFRALTKYRFREGIDAGLAFARTQGGHGSESRTGEIMRELVGYGSAARGAIPQLESLIAYLDGEAEAGRFPKGELNQRRIDAVRDAIRSIAEATDHPPLRSIADPIPPVAR